MGSSQVLYSIAALTLLAVVSFHMSLGITSTQRMTHKNEILSQVAGISNEILEDIGAHDFDNRTRIDLYEEPPSSVDELTLPSGFGGIAAADCHSSCMDIDDFHGLTFERNRRGLDYDIEVAVRYVDPSDPKIVSTSPTFAKEVVLGITSDLIHSNEHPDSLVVVEVSRVFSYLKTTL